MSSTPFDAARRGAALDPQDPTALARMRAEALRVGIDPGFAYTFGGWDYFFQVSTPVAGAVRVEFRFSYPEELWWRKLPPADRVRSLALAALRWPGEARHIRVPKAGDFHHRDALYGDLPVVWHISAGSLEPGDALPVKAGNPFLRALRGQDPDEVYWSEIYETYEMQHGSAGFPRSKLPTTLSVERIAAVSKHDPCVFAPPTSPGTVCVARRIFGETAVNDSRELQRRGLNLYTRLEINYCRRPPGVATWLGLPLTRVTPPPSVSIWPSVDSQHRPSAHAEACYRSYIVEPAFALGSADECFASVALWQALSTRGLQVPVIDRSGDWPELNPSASRQQITTTVFFTPDPA